MTLTHEPTGPALVNDQMVCSTCSHPVIVRSPDFDSAWLEHIPTVAKVREALATRPEGGLLARIEAHEARRDYSRPVRFPARDFTGLVRA